MRRPRSLLRGVVSTIALLVCAPSHANPAELVEIGGRLGLTALVSSVRADDLEVSPSLLPADRVNEGIEIALAQYAATRNAYTQAKAGGEILSGTTEALTAYSAYTGFVPGVVLGIGLNAITDVGNEHIDMIMRQQSTELLAALGNEIVAISGATDFAELANQPELLSATILEHDELLSDVKRRAQDTGDTELVSTVATAMADVALDLANSGLELGGSNAADISRLEDRLANTVETVSDGFEQLETMIADQERTQGVIIDAVGQLQQSIVTLESELSTLGNNQAIIADFVFARMTAAERVAALRGGLMDSRVTCPPENSGCDPAQVVSALVERYEAEAELEEIMSDIGGVLTQVNTVAQIASDLGINLGSEVGTALNIANSAFSAATSFASGNILGGIAEITGLFGSKQDAAAERHRQLMSFLQKNFEHINRQLQTIQQNQQVILESLVTVSSQIENMHRQLDGRLAALMFEIQNIGVNTRSLLWENWRSCNTVYQYSRFPLPGVEVRLVDPHTLLYGDFQSRRVVIEAQRSQVTDCISTMQQEASSFANSGIFGTFLDLERSVISIDTEQAALLDAATADDDMPNYRSIAQQYYAGIVQPTSRIMLDFVQRAEVEPASMLYSYAANFQNFEGVQQMFSVLSPTDGTEPWSYACVDSAPDYLLIAGLVCRSDEPQERALEHLDLVLNPQVLPDVLQWVAVTSQLADLYYGDPDQFAQKIGELAEIGGISIGRELVQSYISVATVALAHQQRLSGGIMAYIIADDIAEGRAGTDHLTAITANSYLAHNVLVIILSQARLTQTDSIDFGPSFEERYAQAFTHAQSGSSNAFLPLQALFGESLMFSLTENDQPGLNLQVNGQEMLLPLPAPIALAAGQFLLPPSHSEIEIERNRLIERLADYELGGDLEVIQMVSSE